MLILNRLDGTGFLHGERLQLSRWLTRDILKTVCANVFWHAGEAMYVLCLSARVCKFSFLTCSKVQLQFSISQLWTDVYVYGVIKAGCSAQYFNAHKAIWFPDFEPHSTHKTQMYASTAGRQASFGFVLIRCRRWRQPSFGRV